MIKEQRLVNLLSPYELVLKEIERGTLDPFDIDLRHLIELFRKEADKLKEWEYFEEAGRFLEACTKLLKLQIEDIFPSPEPERKKVTIKDIRDVLVDTEDNYEQEYDLSWLWDHKVRTGRPHGARDKQERKLSWKEFWSSVQEVHLHKEINYYELAKRVREEIKKGRFQIKTITDFIAYLFAYYEFEDVPDLFGHGTKHVPYHNERNKKSKDTT